MIKILFICHGNICRSPMGEFILKDMVKKAGREGDFEIASAATSREALDRPVYPPARRELEKHGISFDGKISRQVTRDDYRHYDRIYYMDSRNRKNLAGILPADPDKIRPLCPWDVADPWYTGDFSQAWEDIFYGCEKIMEEFA